MKTLSLFDRAMQKTLGCFINYSISSMAILSTSVLSTISPFVTLAASLTLIYDEITFRESTSTTIKELFWIEGKNEARINLYSTSFEWNSYGGLYFTFPAGQWPGYLHPCVPISVVLQQVASENKSPLQNRLRWKHLSSLDLVVVRQNSGSLRRRHPRSVARTGGKVS